MNSCLPRVYSSCVKGLCDPYVTVELLPEEFFGSEVKKTEIIKNTLYPLFDEQFDLWVTELIVFGFVFVSFKCRTINFFFYSSDVEPELLRETGACLHMTVMDYDVFSNDDFAGHVFFNLNNILGLREVIAGGFANIPQETKNIFHPKPEGLYFEGKNEVLSILREIIFNPFTPKGSLFDE